MRGSFPVTARNAAAARHVKQEAPAGAHQDIRSEQKAFAARLGLPKDATNGEILAALDKKLAAHAAAAAPSVDEALQAMAYGKHTNKTRALFPPPPQPNTLTPEDQALYDAAFGK